MLLQIKLPQNARSSETFKKKEKQVKEIIGT